ncbi:MAG: TonB-dependent receptor [Chitinophagaceae bacterium]
MKFTVTQIQSQASTLSRLLPSAPARALFLIVCFMLSIASAFAQGNIQVKGRVLNEKGQPVSKASVVVKGTTTGTSTNENGDFEITAPSNGTLVISSVGYGDREISVNGRQDIPVSLSLSTIDMEQVVVVGYGSQKRKDVTGSVVTVSGEALREVPSANVISQLQGRAAGLDIVRNNSRPGTAGQIRIRGNRSLASSQAANDQQNSPLLVLDGIPYGGSINDINPDDVNNIEILKDASATAIYGSRGSNGVIIITTKRGRTGKGLISYNAYYGISRVTGKYPFFNGTEYAAYKEEARLATPTQTSNYGLTAAEQAGLAAGTNTDWQELLYQPAYITSHEISASGGSAGTQFSFGGGYFKETTVVPGQDFERFSLRTTIDHRLNNRIRLGFNTINTLSYTNGESLNPLYNSLKLSPLVSAYNPDGSINLFPIAGSSDPTSANPLTIIDNDEAIKNTRRRIRTFNSLYGEVQILKDLKYRINVGLDFRHDHTGNYLGPNTLYNAGTSNVNVLGTTAASSIGTGEAEAWTYVIENLLMYEKTIRDKHRVTVTGLFSTQKDRSQSNSFNAQGIPADYIQDYNLNLASGNLIANAGGFSERGLVSYMGRLNYVYNDKYLLTATVRRDGSSVLSPGNQWFTYPAIAVGWNIMNEDFMRNSNVISNIKLRAGWGITSNQSINPYTTLGTLATNYYNYGTALNLIGYFVPDVPNKSLHWESTENWNVGLDFGILKNRITGAIDLYSQKTKDILLRKNLPRSTGTTATIVNAGKTKGHGVEVSLSSINIKDLGGFSWSTDLNFAINKEEIVELQDPSLLEDIGNGWFVGQPLTVIYDVKKIGIWQTSEAVEAAKFGQKPGQIKVADVNGAARDGKPDGKIDGNDRMVLGNFQPDWIGGITNRFAYKNFDLSVVIFARMGQTVVLPYLASDGGANGYPFFNNSRVNSLKRDYWTPANATNEFPRPDASSDNVQYSSTLAYRDGSFIKCRSINLGYNFSSRLLAKAGMNSLRVYFTAQNPFLIYSPLVKDDLALDPEGNGYGGSINSGAGGTPVMGRSVTVNLNTPPTRQFLFGVNLKF